MLDRMGKLAGRGRPAPDRVGRGTGRIVMVGVSQRPSRHERREWWRRQLARQQSANLSVTEFCRQLGVSLTTFYYWKKRISEAAPNTSRREPARCLGTSGDRID